MDWTWAVVGRRVRSRERGRTGSIASARPVERRDWEPILEVRYDGMDPGTSLMEWAGRVEPIPHDEYDDGIIRELERRVAARGF
jgi:hypothetical protein